MPRLIESYEDDTFIHAITEYLPGDCLAELLQDTKKCNSLSIDDILSIFYQICKAAAYFRAEKVIHRDFKPANIMVHKSEKNSNLGYLVSVVDFGFAKKKQKDPFSRSKSKEKFAKQTNLC